MMFASPFRELTKSQITSLRSVYEKTRKAMVANYYDK